MFGIEKLRHIVHGEGHGVSVKLKEYWFKEKTRGEDEHLYGRVRGGMRETESRRRYKIS